jgi:ribosomal protein S18 acetylase RimI-like enzyme
MKRGFVMTALERTTLLNISIPVRLRMAGAEDLPKLEWYGQYVHYRNVFRRAYREQLSGQRVMLLADSNNFPIGHIFIQFINPDSRDSQDYKQAYLYSFRVMEMFRGCGIGTRLLLEAENIVLDRDIHRTTIAVSKQNQAARRLYERLGYRIFADDSGNWSYVDHLGRTRYVQEPCWLLQKEIRLR